MEKLSMGMDVSKIFFAHTNQNILTSIKQHMGEMEIIITRPASLQPSHPTSVLLLPGQVSDHLAPYKWIKSNTWGIYIPQPGHTT